MIRPNILPLEHVPNARDLGGYVGADGRKIKCIAFLELASYTK